MTIDEIMKELAEYIRMSEELTAQVEALKDQIKAYMSSTGVDELAGREHKVIWRSVISSRVDTTSLRRDVPDVVEKYLKIIETKRFTFV